MKSSPPVRTVSIMGCGWFGLPLAIRLVRSGFIVQGSTTNIAKRAKLKSFGIQDYLIQLNPSIVSPDQIETFFDADVLVLNIPPGVRKDSGESKFRLMMDNLLPHLTASTIRMVIFISSTSVYADCNGVVTEADAGIGDLSPAGKLLFETEKLFMNRPEFQTTVLRFGGLYGSDRHPAKFLAGKTDLQNPDAPVNLVHLEDCIRVTERIIRKQVFGEIFNVVSDEHPPRKRYYTEVCRRLGLKKPEFDITNELNAWKLVSNRKLKEFLPYVFRYPSPYEGP